MTEQDNVDLIYRQYKMNCITKPPLYNSNFKEDCIKFTDELKTILKKGKRPSDLSRDDEYNSLLTTLNVTVSPQPNIIDLGNNYQIYKAFCNSPVQVNADADRITCNDKKSNLVNIFNSDIVDTIGPNKSDPTKWVIPDGEFRPLLTKLGIVEPYKQNINEIINERKKAKSLTYRLAKLTSGKGGKTKSRTKRTKGAKRRRTRRRGRKSQKHYKKRK